MIVLEYLAYFLITIGAVFLFLGALGIFRMPDLYTRIQAGTKASTLGAMSLILGVGLLGFISFTPGYPWLIKTFVIVVFVAIANPLSSHALARGAYKDKLIPFSKEHIDAYEEVENKNKEEKEDTNE